MADQDWNIGNKSGLVDVGTARLFVQVCGPDRKPDEPLVVIIQGMGSCASSWAAVTRLLQPYIRVLIYDRAGLGKSETSRLRPNMSTSLRASELSAAMGRQV